MGFLRVFVCHRGGGFLCLSSLFICFFLPCFIVLLMFLFVLLPFPLNPGLAECAQAVKWKQEHLFDVIVSRFGFRGSLTALAISYQSSVNLSNNRSSNQSSIKQPINQSINQTTYLSIDHQLSNQSIKQSSNNQSSIYQSKTRSSNTQSIINHQAINQSPIDHQSTMGQSIITQSIN